MTLYIDRLDFEGAFRAPCFTVVLGRSQDLAWYTKVDTVELVPSDRGYYENTILPGNFRRRTARGVTVLMPRFVGPPPLRETSFDRYIVLQERIYTGPRTGDGLGTREMLQIEHAPTEFLVDPQSPEWRGVRRALEFHSFA